ncbi:MAG: right-handed parallel beta-helix repeat-containing protein [Betaproteobacteria bacterium]
MIFLLLLMWGLLPAAAPRLWSPLDADGPQAPSVPQGLRLAESGTSNQQPIVSVGSTQTITLPATANLTGTATDDGLPTGSTLTRWWSAVSGPGSVAFGNIYAPSTTASFSIAGTYVLRLTASDSALSTTADVTISVVGAASSCTGVTVQPTTLDLQALVNAHPEGTIFCLQPGTYRPTSSVLARSGDSFVGQPGVILDGRSTLDRGIYGFGGSTGQSHVTVQGLTLINYTGAAISMGWYWTVSHNELHHNRIGVTGNSYGMVDGNSIHDNQQYGITGGPATDLSILNNEVARNNTAADCGGACYGDAGGSKIVGSSIGTFNLIWRNNNVHDNTGMGIWSDGNVRATYENNTVSNNSGVGIFHEISWDAVIRNNTLTNNDSESIGQSCWHGSQIHVNNSSNVEIYGNTVTATNGANGICAVSVDRSETAPHSTVVTNLNVHDNVVYMTGSSTSGMVQDPDSANRPNAINNRFTNNSYFLPDLTGSWWNWPSASSSPASWSQWQVAGQDTGGTINATK